MGWWNKYSKLTLSKINTNALYYYLVIWIYTHTYSPFNIQISPLIENFVLPSIPLNRLLNGSLSPFYEILLLLSIKLDTSEINTLSIENYSCVLHKDWFAIKWRDSFINCFWSLKQSLYRKHTSHSWSSSFYWPVWQKQHASMPLLKKVQATSSFWLSRCFSINESSLKYRSENSFILKSL